MSAMQPLCELFGINPDHLSKSDFIILETKLFIHIYDELKEIFRAQYKDYFDIMKFTIDKENAMLEANFIRLAIHDILSSEEYTLEGIALYTNTHEDILQDIFTGQNVSPSISLLRKIIELHRSIRIDCYNTIIKKIKSKFSECSSMPIKIQKEQPKDYLP